MTLYGIGLLVIGAATLLSGAVLVLGLYGSHYPNGRKKR